MDARRFADMAVLHEQDERSYNLLLPEIWKGLVIVSRNNFFLGSSSKNNTCKTHSTKNARRSTDHPPDIDNNNVGVRGMIGLLASWRRVALA